ncbi:MAG: ParB/RepB/Spo0J family partition protein [Actinobacteria bacterium]|nr:ParB/RepB/Spo0J family partition protein [Actinomycetota bacterium]MBU1943587.1 ParB/RepB/Spo0J family partition protein [Actinomycetota bacterium]MBU2688921.1 ParB/RepB/Spo0J family partition protein [Actinomycetota bacterium]
MAKKGLGKGLDVLIGSAASAEGSRLEEIPVAEIEPNPRQPRRTFDEGSIEQMARSIEVFGVVQPVVVRPHGTEYELIAGERRWRAAKAAGLEKIPAVIRHSTETDSLEMALIENLHRQDLNGIEEANAYQQLLDDFGITHEELSRKVGRSRTAITNSLRLLGLPARIQREVVDGSITAGHARTLLALQEDPEGQDNLCTRIIEEGLSVRQVEQLVAGGVPGAAPETATIHHRARREPPPEAQRLFDRLAEMLDTRVKGSVGKRKGRLVIEFRDFADLERIFSSMAGTRLPSPGVEGSDAAEQEATGSESAPAGRATFVETPPGD